MTGGGFYVVSFVSCSSCFMLKFSCHYVIKLLGVWRAQAPLFLIAAVVLSGGKCISGRLLSLSPSPSVTPSSSILFCFSHSEAQISVLVFWQWKFQSSFGATLGSDPQTPFLICGRAIQVWKGYTPVTAVGSGGCGKNPLPKNDAVLGK